MDINNYITQSLRAKFREAHHSNNTYEEVIKENRKSTEVVSNIIATINAELESFTPYKFLTANSRSIGNYLESVHVLQLLDLRLDILVRDTLYGYAINLRTSDSGYVVNLRSIDSIIPKLHVSKEAKLYEDPNEFRTGLQDLIVGLLFIVGEHKAKDLTYRLQK